jgi:hypothetical protein
MNIVYNGVILTGVRLNSWTRERVLDQSGQDVLYDRHVIDATCILNPGMMSGGYKPGEYDRERGYKLDTFSPAPGLSAGATDVALRRVLTEPRRRLVVISGDDVVLDTSQDYVAGEPSSEFVGMDANNGPKVLRFSVIKALGDRTFLVHFVVEACVKECGKNKDSDQTFLLSNRFSTTHDVDENHYTTITYSGVSIFRTDLLDSWEREPDSFRRILFPSCPKGFQRKNVHVEAVPSRNALVWTVVDREMPYYLGEGKKNKYGVVSFQATKTQTIQKTGGVAAGMPTLTVQCRAVGNKESSRMEITKFCMKFIVSECWIGRYPEQIILNDLTITQQLHEKVAEVSCTITYPPVGFDRIVNEAGEWSAAWGNLLDDELLYLMDKDQGNLQPPNAGGTRGTYDYLMFANFAAKNACGIPTAPNAGKSGFFLPASDPSLSSPRTAAAPNSVRAGSAAATQTAGATPEPISDPTSITSRVNGVTVRASVSADWPMPDTKVRARAHWYTDCRVFVHWITHGGRIVMPVCGGSVIRPGSKRVSVIQAHTEYQEKVIEYEMTRIGKEPERPNPYTYASQSSYRDETLMDHRVTSGSPVLGPDGLSVIYSCKGVARYIYQRTFRYEGVDSFPTAVAPWLSLPFSQAYMTPGSFVHHVAEDVKQPNDDRLAADFFSPYQTGEDTWNTGPTVNRRK